MINKKTTIALSTAALMAGTACGVYAESDERAATSFDRSGLHFATVESDPYIAQQPAQATTLHHLR